MVTKDEITRMDHKMNETEAKVLEERNHSGEGEKNLCMALETFRE